MLAFAYILVVVIIALEVPLAINLQRRVRAEVEGRAEVTALTIAAAVGAENIAAATGANVNLGTTDLQRWVYRNFSHTEDGRVIVLDPTGRLIADSTGTAQLGSNFDNGLRPEVAAVLQSHQPYSEFRYSSTLAQEILVAAAPIIDERFVGMVRYTRGVGEAQSGVRRAILGAIVIGVAALLAGLMIAFALADSLSRPLTRLAAAARRLGRGDLSTRTEKESAAREIGDLATAFDDMADRLESMVTAQREFVANASHQLRTPLTGMKLRLESAIERTDADDLRRQLEAADREVDRLADIVERLLVIARGMEQDAAARVDVGDAVHRAVERWGERARGSGSTLSARGEAGTAIGERADLDQILDNLLDNAISYAPGPLTIEAGDAGAQALIAVEDGGPGITAEERDRVTERFYRGKGVPPGGSGLGLAIVRELAEKWGGSVRLLSGEAGGTRVEVRLPRPPSA